MKKCTVVFGRIFLILGCFIILSFINSLSHVIVVFSLKFLLLFIILKDGERKNKSEWKIDVVLAKFVETGKFVKSAF